MPLPSLPPIPIAWLGLAVLGACATAPKPEPRFPDLGAYRRPITCADAEARAYFDQGLLWTYGFNHDEAVRSFRAAEKRDPNCTMAYFGEAFALGPNINLPMADPAVGHEAYVAAQAAYADREGGSPVEQALVEALVTRYEDPPPTDRARLDRAWADAMHAVHQRFPDDPDVAALYADALLNCHPWDQWTPDGEPKEDTLEIVAVLEDGLAKHPDHPGLNHFYIHTVEASSTPERALPSAERLPSLVPGSGHLVHMPAHIWQRTGRYKDAEDTNTRACAVDGDYFARVGPQGIYEFYRAHNHHFRAYSAMFAGRFGPALQATHDLVDDLPPHAFTDLVPYIDGFLPLDLHVLVRFGKFDQVLAAPDYPERFVIARTMRHYARGVSFAATGRVSEARSEQVAFEEAATRVADDATIGINPALPVIDVARQMLIGEIAYREQRFDDAFAALRRGVELEDALRYDEPSPWMQPVRHALGALLLEQDHVAEAEAVYRADLERHRENGWSLDGLAECLRRRGADDEAAAVQARFEKAWAFADTPLGHGSCFCRQAVTRAGGCCDSPGSVTDD